jgi:BirA family biotin operon repressor/biotin-[acetyl-CoA-carboxylase] ligase
MYAQRIDVLLVEWTLESTNTGCWRRLPRRGTAAVVLAEHQTGGAADEGADGSRRPAAPSACRSAGNTPTCRGSVRAVVGRRALRRECADLGRRPRRLFEVAERSRHAEGKLGGILVEMRAESGGPVHVVAGIGLNVALDDQARATVKTTGNTADDIRAHCSPVPDRNAIVARHSWRASSRRSKGFRATVSRHHLENWHACDVLHDRKVRIENAGEITRGMARGIDAHGALLVETPAACNVSFPARSPCESTHESNPNTLLVDIGNTRVKWATLRGLRSHACRRPRTRTPGSRCAPGARCATKRQPRHRRQRRGRSAVPRAR